MIDIQQINAAGTDLRKHQLMMFEILVYIDEICRKNKIDYWLSGGTLLGAVRHKGFIPWDDDLDIVLLKKDLKRLHRLLLKDNQFPYQLQANDTDYNYIAPYEKIRIPGTEIKENNDNDHYYKYKGIYIDLFFWESAIHFCHFIANKLQRLFMLLTKKNKYLGRKNILKFFYFAYSKIIYPVLGRISYLVSPGMLSYPLGSFFSTQFKKKWIYPLKELEFEGKKFLVPNNYDAVLKAQYGNYMQFPPLDKIEYHTCSVKFKI